MKSQIPIKRVVIFSVFDLILIKCKSFFQILIQVKCVVDKFSNSLKVLISIKFNNTVRIYLLHYIPINSLD